MSPASEPYPPMDKRTGPVNGAYPDEPGKGKGPGQRLRTGVRPVGHERGLRCLLGARAHSTPNPVQPDEPLGPANEPVAGLSSNIPPIVAMSTAHPALRWRPKDFRAVLSGLSAVICRFCPSRDA